MKGPKAMGLWWCDCGAVIWSPDEHRQFCSLGQDKRILTFQKPWGLRGLSARGPRGLRGFSRPSGFRRLKTEE